MENGQAHQARGLSCPRKFHGEAIELPGFQRALKK
jgi:hypothetical protein